MKGTNSNNNQYIGFCAYLIIDYLRLLESEEFGKKQMLHFLSPILFESKLEFRIGISAIQIAKEKA